VACLQGPCRIQSRRSIRLPPERRTSNALQNGWKFSEVVDDLGYRAADIAQQEFVIRAESVEDIRRAHQDGKVAIVPAIESCMPIENELDRLDVLYGIGVRLMGVTYVESNALGQGGVTCIHTTEGSPRSANRRSNE